MLKIYEIMAFEHVAGIPLNYDQNPRHRQSTRYQIVLSFQI